VPSFTGLAPRAAPEQSADRPIASAHTTPVSARGAGDLELKTVAEGTHRQSSKSAHARPGPEERARQRQQRRSQSMEA